MIPLASLRPAPADRVVSSPNHGARGVSRIQLIILHATADEGSEEGAERWMADPRSQVSAHLHIRRDGSITRMVPDTRRAWHAGRSSWPGVSDVNDASLGWEIANRNDGREEYTDAQYRTVAHLLRHYLPQGLQRSDVLAHSMVAPGRKEDPLGWEWDRMWSLYDHAAQVEKGHPDAPKPPNLERIYAPTPPVLREVARVRLLDPERIMDYAAAFEAVFRIMSNSGVRQVKPAADFLALALKMEADDA